MIDLVMGYARGYDGPTVRPFLKTLRSTGYCGKVVMIADGQAATEAAKWGADVRGCSRPAPRMKPHSARFVDMAFWARALDWSGLFVVDTRDVIFQRDITEALSGEGLNVYEEDRSMTLGTCPYNSLWLKLGYGALSLQQISHYPISCVGTVHGGRPEMLRYLDALCAQVRNIQPKTHKPQDQAAHNWLCRRVLKPTIIPNELGEVYTVGYIKRRTVRIVDDQVVNQSGHVPAVIHQWDRHPNLKELVEKIV